MAVCDVPVGFQMRAPGRTDDIFGETDSRTWARWNGVWGAGKMGKEGGCRLCRLSPSWCVGFPERPASETALVSVFDLMLLKASSSVEWHSTHLEMGSREHGYMHVKCLEKCLAYGKCQVILKIRNDCGAWPPKWSEPVPFGPETYRCFNHVLAEKWWRE